MFKDPIYWFNISRWGAIIGSAVILISGIGLWYFGRINSKNTDKEIQASRTEAANANRAAALANEGAAKANERTKIVELQLENSKMKVAQVSLKVEEEAKKRAQAEITLAELKTKVGYRKVLNYKAFEAELSKGRKCKITIIYEASDIEAMYFAEDIQGHLLTAEWEAELPRPVTAEAGKSFSHSIGRTSSRSNPHDGVWIMRSSKDPNVDPKDINSPYARLVAAFDTIGIKTMGSSDQGAPIKIEKGSLRIIIGSRL